MDFTSITHGGCLLGFEKEMITTGKLTTSLDYTDNEYISKRHKKEFEIDFHNAVQQNLDSLLDGSPGLPSDIFLGTIHCEIMRSKSDNYIPIPVTHFGGCGNVNVCGWRLVRQTKIIFKNDADLLSVELKNNFEMNFKFIINEMIEHNLFDHNDGNWQDADIITGTINIKINSTRFGDNDVVVPIIDKHGNDVATVKVSGWEKTS